MEQTTIVMKFGGAALATPQHFDKIADIILAKQASRIVAVVSAMGSTTDQLIALAKEVNSSPPQRELDMLVSVGERISMALLAMALAKKGREAISYTGSQSGIITSAHHAEAKIINVKPARILNSLDKNQVVIVAGFQGVSQQGEITTLGRGGTDTSAVALGIALRASIVEFYKDVAGLYSHDPKTNRDAVFYPQATYDEALSIIERGAKILHNRSVLLAKANGTPLHILPFNDTHLASQGTIIRDTISFSSTPHYEEHISC